MAGRLVQPASASFIHWLSISGQLCTGSWAREIAKKEPSTSDACGARPPCVVRSQREANKDKDHPATKTENCPRKRGRSMWRSVKYEEVYLHAYESVTAARNGIGRYIESCNTRRPHTALDRQTPDTVYFGSLPLAAAAYPAELHLPDPRKLSPFGEPPLSPKTYAADRASPSRGSAVEVSLWGGRYRCAHTAALEDTRLDRGDCRSTAIRPPGVHTLTARERERILQIANRAAVCRAASSTDRADAGGRRDLYR